MKVRFEGTSSQDARVSQGAESLRVGNEYLVLEIYSQTDRGNYFRIESMPGELPGLFDSRLFSVTARNLPSTWRAFTSASGSLSLCPEPWGDPGFWESLMDGELWAIECYRTEKSMIESL
ncbi:hypothetical protein ACH4FX_08090 [Streptomyces sp. NPDC018019]|uniref:hypothetical protein n=1 Tax=Streptomyces sp. NPDC018019 TaxID=3365030 RepID=UPI00378CD40A